MLLTVLGLARARARSMLVGARRRRSCASARRKGIDLVPLTPKTEMDLSAAVAAVAHLIKTLSPDVVHAHESARRAMAGAGPVDEHGQLDKPPLGGAPPRRLSLSRGNELSR
jgi:hypothetical protein